MTAPASVTAYVSVRYAVEVDMSVSPSVGGALPEPVPGVATISVSPSVSAEASATTPRTMPEFDAIGAGATRTNGTTGSWNASWSHSATEGSAVLVVVAEYAQLGTPSVTAQYGGASMTNLGSRSSPVSNFVVTLFGITDVDGGTKTVQISSSASPGPMRTGAANSFSYIGVDSFRTSSTANGNASGGAAMPISISSGDGEMAFVAYGVFNSGNASAPSVTSFNGTQRYSQTASNSNSPGNAQRLFVGDMESDSTSVDMSANSNNYWAAIGVSMIGVTVQEAEPASATITVTPSVQAKGHWATPASVEMSVSPSLTIHGQQHHNPETTVFSSSGTWTAPDWLRAGIDFVDVIAVGGGGGGGGAGFGASNGGPGGASRADYETLPGSGVISNIVLAEGGYRGDTDTGGGGAGIGSGNHTYRGVLYEGSPEFNYDGDGIVPGGGGEGGNFFGAHAAGGGGGDWDDGTITYSGTSISVTVGARGSRGGGIALGHYGARGQVWVVARQKTLTQQLSS
ncbi:hypothetical protein PXH78_27010 [Mycolicibacterium smegmatis]|uniref:hypothetical protein n=1 Tax=Mycolicibacterium smegmatis TaxID=1772 RepID=UPI0012FF6401|nr:hypothetical protein [Mycolicibacterium smegmatis]MDF1902763.1 hypothetical protein [Mycolicibacterium smegmatis]MDF1909039.1 hypothetical protein [Mycolicibacterium smegmatis]MDF1921258.1 hypothetical protein [Mycolicibacterium smegmatis]MDF1927523.1 hypothetical protein [Mycolicibacterium smegmatis]UAK53378.1 hypothetical protein K8P01_22570 [Mycolicibacterium smegmatis]